VGRPPPDVPRLFLGPRQGPQHELTGASDIHEVLRWAEDNREGRAYTVYVVAKGHDSQIGIVRLAGEDPTRRD